ncbi:hypothetical protein ACPCKW_11530 [Streptomyces griseoincarnatus]
MCRLGLLPRKALAKDAGVDDHGDRFPGVILTHTAATRNDVDTLLTAAVALADGQVTAAADRPEQGDHSGHFTDPDGHHWTITTRA